MKSGFRFKLFLFTGLWFGSLVILSGQENTSNVSRLFEMDLTELMNQKVITASRFEQTSSEAASSVGIITSDDIKNFGYKTLGEALNSQRGMYLSNDKNYLYVGSRGFSRPTDYNNRIVIMIDGHITNEVVYGSAFMGNELGINLNNVEKIEIIRGPGASVYGSGAMLNIVNVITKKGADIDGGSVSAGIGSFGLKTFSALFGKKFGKTDISLSGTGGISDGENYYFNELDAPETNNGISDGMDWEKFIGFQAKITLDKLKFSGGYATRFKGIPTGAFDTDLTGDVKSVDDKIFADASYKLDLKKNSSLLFRTYYDDYFYSGSYPSDALASFDESKGRWFGGEAQYYLEAGKSNIITAGIEYRYAFRADYKEWDNDTTYFDHNYPFSFFSVYAQDQIRILPDLTLTAGFRYDKYSVSGDALSPRLSLVYKYSTYSSVKLLYSEAFRIPNVYETYYESFNSHRTNPSIHSEKIRAGELLWSHKISGILFGSLSFYHFRFANLIDQVTPETDSLTQFLNIGNASGSGIEYELIYRAGENKARAFLNLTYQKAVDDDVNLRLSNSPEFMIKSGVVIPVLKHFYIVPEFFFESGRKTLTDNKTDDIFLFNLGINSVKFFNHFEASLKATNLFNTKYFYPGGYEHSMDKIVQDSRNIYLKVAASF